MMVGILVSFWDGQFLGVMLNFRGVMAGLKGNKWFIRPPNSRPAQAEHRNEEEAGCDVDKVWLFVWDVLLLMDKSLHHQG